MTAEQMFQQIIEVNNYINELVEEREEALTHATHITPILKEDVIQTARENGMEKKMIAYAEYHYLLDREIDKYIDLKRQAMKYVMQLKELKHQVVLIRFYFKNQTVKKIADRLCYDERTVKRLKNDAIAEIDRIMSLNVTPLSSVLSKLLEDPVRLEQIG